jgi:hypothetical protein
VRLVVPWWCGRAAAAWLHGDPEIQHQLAAELIAFEAEDDLTTIDHRHRAGASAPSRWPSPFRITSGNPLMPIADCRPPSTMTLAINQPALIAIIRPAR